MLLLISTMRWRGKLNYWTLKKLLFGLNVRRKDGKTLIGRPQNGGNHWVMVDVDLRPFMKIIYCDRLAWQPTPDIIEVVNDFVRYIPQVGMNKKSHLVLSHSTSATNATRPWMWLAMPNYSLKSCTDIYGVITLVNAAVVILYSPLFQWLIGPVIRETIVLETTDPILVIFATSVDVVVRRRSYWNRLCLTWLECPNKSTN